MTEQEEQRLIEDFADLRSRLISAEEARADAEKKLEELSERIATIEAASVVNSESGDDDGFEGEAIRWPTPLKDDENPQVVSPDSVVWSGTGTRKSVAWAPDGLNVQQLHEFDDAPSVGTIHLVASVSGSSGTSSGSGQSVTLKLVDPDGHTAEEDTSQKWMVPLRQADGNGKVLHWARIGNSVTFDVGSIIEMPCPPTIDATISGTSVVICVHTYEKVNGDCVETSGSPQCVTIPLNEFNLNCEDVRNCISGATETVVTDVFVSGDGNLYKTIRTAKALEWGDPSGVMIVSGTTCEEGSVTA